MEPCQILEFFISFFDLMFCIIALIPCQQFSDLSIRYVLMRWWYLVWIRPTHWVRLVATLGHIIRIPSQPVLLITSACSTEKQQNPNQFNCISLVWPVRGTTNICHKLQIIEHLSLSENMGSCCSSLVFCLYSQFFYRLSLCSSLVLCVCSQFFCFSLSLPSMCWSMYIDLRLFVITSWYLLPFFTIA